MSTPLNGTLAITIYAFELDTQLFFRGQEEIRFESETFHRHCTSEC